MKTIRGKTEYIRVNKKAGGGRVRLKKIARVEGL